MAQNPQASRSTILKEALARGLINTPGGFRRPIFVHIVRANQSVVKRGGVSHLMDMATAVLSGGPADLVAPKDPADQSGGWSTWATWNNQTGKSISSFATTWTVPPAPGKLGSQLVYLFNGLQNPAGSEILQPVLQWGVSGAGGGNFWSVASWHVDSNGHAYCTPTIQVNPGDVLTGAMTEVAVFSDGTRNYKCEFQGIAATSLMALGMAQLTAAEETLEAYGLDDPADYPQTPFTAMAQIDIQAGGNPVPVNWTPNTMTDPLYGEHAVIVNNANPGGEVNLYY
ncbi:MAG: hypothetical protein ACLQG3_00180 [Terracidiphilus sp.]